MRRLNAIDADMLYAEQPTWHLHVGGVMLLDPPPQGLDFETWRAELATRIGRVAPMRERIVPVPLGLDRPLWVRDPAFDLDAHVHHIRVPVPGGRGELATVVGDFAGRKLDRRRPLWEMWFVDGLADGRVAVLAKVHHAAADGVAAAFLLGQFLDVAPAPSAAALPPEAAPLPPEPVPSQVQLFLDGLGSLARSPLRALGSLRRTVSSAGGVLALRRSADSGAAALPFRGPRTVFNRPVTANRSFAFAAVPLADVKAVKDAFDATVNDVVLALCASALRRYLQLRHELPDGPLTAAVPVSTRRPDEMGTYGNRVSGLFTTLPVDVADPVERLAAAHRAAEEAKRLYASGVEDTLIDWADVPPPMAMSLGVRVYTWTHLSERVPPIFNLLVSNVPGSPVPVYAGEAPVSAIYPLGPVLDDIGLNISILSHVDQIGFGLVSCPELMPDLWDLADAIPAALTELAGACPRPSPAPGRRSTAARRQRSA